MDRHTLVQSEYFLDVTLKYYPYVYTSHSIV